MFEPYCQTSLGCGHTFCEICVLRNFNIQSPTLYCPLCKSSLQCIPIREYTLERVLCLVTDSASITQISLFDWTTAITRRSDGRFVRTNIDNTSNHKRLGDEPLIINRQSDTSSVGRHANWLRCWVACVLYKIALLCFFGYLVLNS